MARMHPSGIEHQQGEDVSRPVCTAESHCELTVQIASLQFVVGLHCC